MRGYDDGGCQSLENACWIRSGLEEAIPRAEVILGYTA